jgi:hypothetical protein
MLEFAAQVDAHMAKIIQTIEKHHWRTNPSVLAGMRVAVFRKGSGAVPTIVTGCVIPLVHHREGENYELC